MTRYTVFVLIVLGSAASALAAIAPQTQLSESNPLNVTVIEKNQAFPLVGPLIVEDCEAEDCSVTPS
jgi:hypothetical protein